MTSNVSQSYPYSSETGAERAAAVAAVVATHAGLEATLAAAALPPEAPANPPDAGDRWWTYHHAGCGGIFHVAGFARDQHAVVVVCDRCAGTALR